MRIGCAEACACISPCYESVKQSLATTIITFRKVWHDPEAFQKTGILALAIIREINFRRNTHYLPELVDLLDTAVPAFDFYGFCRLPRLFLHPYTADRLDEYDLLDQLEVILCDNWHLGIENSEGKNRDSNVREFAKKQLTAFLGKMAEEDLDFMIEQEVRTILHNWFEKTLEADPKEDFDPHDINLQDLKIQLKAPSWMETIIDCMFVLVDIGCVPDFLQGWGLVDLAPLANQIGRLPLLAWVPHQTLDDWIWGAAGAGYFLQALYLTQSLWKGELSPNEAKDAKWQLVASIAECLYSVSIIQKRDSRLINGLAIIAKSCGLVVFLVASKPTFFKKKVD